MLEKFIGHCSITRPDNAKTATKKVVHKTNEATGELIGNKIAEKYETETSN